MTLLFRADASLSALANELGVDVGLVVGAREGVGFGDTEGV